MVLWCSLASSKYELEATPGCQGDSYPIDRLGPLNTEPSSGRCEGLLLRPGLAAQKESLCLVPFLHLLDR